VPYIWYVNFTELFAKLPTSSLQDWEAAARKQLKGKPLDSIDISMFDAEQRVPYAAGAKVSFEGGGSQGWIQFSSFIDSPSLSGAGILEALNGGAQGVEVNFRELIEISDQLSQVRFDYISLRINGLSPGQQQALIDLIPEEQRAAARIVIQLGEEGQLTDYQALVSAFGEVKFLLSPKLVVENLESLSLVFQELKSVLTPIEGGPQLEKFAAQVGLEVLLSSDYLKNITYLHAVRILFANAYHSFGLSEPLPRPHIYGRIVEQADQESHEIYLIDATAKAVAAISGGVDALTIKAFSGDDQQVAARRARNIQNVLSIEGLMGVPLNAVVGAAFFETAAKDLVSAIWPDS